MREVISNVCGSRKNTYITTNQMTIESSIDGHTISLTVFVKCDILIHSCLRIS